MARLKELRQWPYKGKHHVRLRFVSGKLIEMHSFDTKAEAEQKAANLGAKWINDLIKEPVVASAYRPVRAEEDTNDF